ncbi:hypothetical protein EG328_008807 [Venturia inaequalis]|uniref:Uncharacterized protein n=1 Tax=Venturia inaequalis TaxID=5025 RepID=A0A8H3UA17_VENIN|nr:hypothetical protein EG328_008807 [Venturia inaequalis]
MVLLRGGVDDASNYFVLDRYTGRLKRIIEDGSSATQAKRRKASGSRGTTTTINRSTGDDAGNTDGIDLVGGGGLEGTTITTNNNRRREREAIARDFEEFRTTFRDNDGSGDGGMNEVEFL